MTRKDVSDASNDLSYAGQRLSFWVSSMIKHFVAIASIALCSLGTAASAQNNDAPAKGVRADSAKHPAPTKKAETKSDDSENWVIAEPKSSKKSTDLNPNLAEGRRKFFEQSTTMEDGGPTGSGETSGSFKPSAGFKF